MLWYVRPGSRTDYYTYYIFCTYVHVRELSSMDCGNELAFPSVSYTYVLFLFLHFLLIFLHSISFNIYIYIFFFLKKKSPLVFGLVCSLRCSSPFSLSTSACYSSVFRVLTMSLVQPIFPIEWIEIKKERKKEKKRK